MHYSKLTIGYETPQVYFTLVALVVRPLNAYSICQQVGVDSGGVIIIRPSSMWHILRRLQRRRLIKPLDDDQPGRPVRCSLVRAGHQIVAREAGHYQLAANAGYWALKGRQASRSVGTLEI
ncbi:MAG TPA: hypothetical protein VLF67_01970 [Candidatus Saccharimonas sp.]|nr:hypothetical protein [Candidatus Saccharimonas sp.]